jgi:hypothetical protein
MIALIFALLLRYGSIHHPIPRPAPPSIHSSLKVDY